MPVTNQDLSDEITKLDRRLSTRLKRIEDRQDKVERDMEELRDVRAGDRAMLVHIAEGLSRLHDRLGPIQDVYETLPQILGRLEQGQREIQEALTKGAVR